MADQACVAFLQWALPRMGLRWPGYRKVRGTVCKRLRRRLGSLGLSDLEAYRRYLDAHPAEWARLESFCRIPISRFYRDRQVFDAIGSTVLPALAAAARTAGRGELRAWSAGCASGEEPYSLSLVWHHRIASGYRSLSLRVLATDVEPRMLARAEQACYAPGSLKDLPEAWRLESFEACEDLFCLKACHRRCVEFRLADIRKETPAGPFDLILCRNLAFTYFDEATQRQVLDRLTSVLRPEGWLVIGKHESLPPGHALVREDQHLGLYRKPDGRPLWHDRGPAAQRSGGR